MVTVITRYVKRFLVLVPGIIIAYLSFQNIFPLIDAYVYAPIAVLLTYILAAYVLIPALIRGYRIVFPTRHLPHYCTTPDGFVSDPINIAIIGTRRQLISAMDAAGWYQADAHTPTNVLHLIVSILTGQTYHSAPMSSLFLLGRRQDIGFQIPIKGERSHRHHVRFWATTYDASQPIGARAIRWKAKRKMKKNEEIVWLGAASKDIGIQLIRHNAQFTHMVHPDTNAERELIVESLQNTKWFATISRITVTDKPYRLANRVWRGYLEADGTLAVCYLKNPSRFHSLSSAFRKKR